MAAIASNGKPAVSKVSSHWIVDSGALRHITAIKTSLKNNEEEATTVVLADDSTVDALGKREVHFSPASHGLPGTIL